MARHDKPPVEKYHDRVAGIYDTIYDGSPYWDVVFEITWRHVTRHLPRDMSIRCLDVGCGTGRWGLKLIKSGYQCDFLDISNLMLEQVRKKIAKMEPAPNFEPEYFHMSVDDMAELGRDRWDFIIGQGDPLNCAQKPERAFKGMVKTLRPGGVVAMSVDNALAGIFHYFKSGDIDELAKFVKTGRTSWITDDESEQYPIKMFSPKEIRSLCEARGLELLSLIGKTVLPLRRFRELLADPEKRVKLTRLEESLNSDEAMFGSAAHLEFIARKPASQATGE